MEPLVAQLVDQLDASDREDFEERAAIMEFEADAFPGHMPNVWPCWMSCIATLRQLQGSPSCKWKSTVRCNGC